MLAHRRVDPARCGEAVGARHGSVEFLAHAVQTLELERPAVPAREMPDRRDRVRVVRGELRMDPAALLQQQPRAGKVGDVGVGLAGEHRVARQSAFLGALDLTVPVGALHQPHVQHAPGLAREINQPAQYRGCALLVGLHGEAETVPAGQSRVATRRLEELEREFEALGLLRVERERDACVARGSAQVDQPRRELPQHAAAMRALEARVQRGELHRDARPGRQVRILAHAGLQRTDRVAVRIEVTRGVGRGQRRLAQHVEGVAVAAVVAGERVVERLGDVAAHHELVAHDPHGLAHGGAHHGLADAAHDACDGARGCRDVARFEAHDASGEHQAPRRGVHEQRLAVAQVARPVARPELVGDQAVGSLVVRNAQQRLGETHQDHAFLRRQVVLAQEGIETGLAGRGRAHRLDELSRRALHLCGGRFVEPRGPGERAHEAFLVGEELAVHGAADGRLQIAGVAVQELRRGALAGCCLVHDVGARWQGARILANGGLPRASAAGPARRRAGVTASWCRRSGRRS